MAVFSVNKVEYKVENSGFKDGVLSATVNGESVSLKIVDLNGDFFVLKGGVFYPVYFARDEEHNLFLNINGQSYKIHEKTIEEQADISSSLSSKGEIEPPMPGKILDVMVKLGDEVDENQPLILMESMKLQIEVKAPFNGVVKEIKVEKGQTVNAGEMLLKIEKSD